MRSFAPGKIELTERIIEWLNKEGRKMTYGDLGKIIQHPAFAMAGLLDEVNLRHKAARRGDTVITGCIVNKASLRPGEGIKSLRTFHGMNVPE
jgi:hypothetical protein